MSTDRKIKYREDKNYTSEIEIYGGMVRKKIIHPLKDELFDREVYWLKKLNNYHFVPDLVSCNKDVYEIVMVYAGERVNDRNKPDNFYSQLFNIQMIFLQNKCMYNDWKIQNTLIKDGNVSIIDFGWCPIIKEDYTCDGVANSDLMEKPGGEVYQL